MLRRGTEAHRSCFPTVAAAVACDDRTQLSLLPPRRGSSGQDIIRSHASTLRMTVAASGYPSSMAHAIRLRVGSMDAPAGGLSTSEEESVAQMRQRLQRDLNCLIDQDRTKRRRALGKLEEALLQEQKVKHTESRTVFMAGSQLQLVTRSKFDCFIFLALECTPRISLNAQPSPGGRQNGRGSRPR